ncbi:MAG: imidazole glycerol phosphate synthase subunit HisH [Sedimentisphaerales bacterium]|nr:imidazole glycerol phosphate synthase subunit HisH [Sedimentisphaerales bacterium]
MIVVIDYDVGNVKSVCNAFDYIGCKSTLSREIQDIEYASGLVLPGVAAFGYAMNALGDLTELIKTVVNNGKPILGICVGYQLLFDRSCEHGDNEGLGFIKGNVVNIPQGRTIPHMGWNSVELPEDMDLFEGLGKAKHFYFAHSYYSLVSDTNAKFAFTDYGFELPAAVQKANVYGTQFHPEKSGPNGLAVLKNFYNICEKGNA